jgi:sugar phosphate isomerase/epimerase
MKPFRVGVDAYSLKPLALDSFELLDWALINGADGVQFSEIPPEADDPGFLRELAQYAAQNDLYLEWGGGEHVPYDLAAGRPKETAAVNERAARQAAAMGIRTVRSCSGGLMRWHDDSIPTETLLRDMARSLRDQRPMLERFGVTLALETHFEFTTFELRRLFDMCEANPGGYLGVCLDTMNLLTMLEDPVAAARRVLPWVVTTHIKDGGILLTQDGLVTFTAEIGHGLVDFASILRDLGSLDRDIRLSIEDHGGSFEIPVFDPVFLAKFPDLAAPEFVELVRLAAETRDRVERHALAVLERPRWPEVCEDRVKKDIAALRRIVATA